MTFDTGSRVTRTTGTTGTSTHTRYSTQGDSRVVEAVVWWLTLWTAVRSTVSSVVRWISDTVTVTGWLIVLTVAIAIPVGVVFGWVELVVAGFAAAVLLVVSAVFLIGRNVYEVTVDISDERVVVGTDVLGTVEVVNTGNRIALRGRIDIPIGKGLVEVHVPTLRPGHSHTESITVSAYRRGIITIGPVTSVRGDPLGILSRELSWADVHQLYVHPRTVQIPSTSAGFIRDLEGNPSRDVVASDISFHAIREYMPGDAQRHVHWKSTAKTGKLMVRQYEETRRSKLAIVLALRADEFADDDEFETAVSAAGSLGLRAIRDGRDVTAVTSDHIPELVRSSVRSIHTLSTIGTKTYLDELSAVETSDKAMPVEDICALAAQTMGDISIAFVVCGSQLGAARLQAAALKFPLDAAVVAVVCDAQAEPRFVPVAELSVMTLGILDDLPQLMVRGSAG